MPLTVVFCYLCNKPLAMWQALHYLQPCILERVALQQTNKVKNSKPYQHGLLNDSHLHSLSQNYCWFAEKLEEFYYLLWVSKKSLYFSLGKKCTEGIRGYHKIDLKLFYLMKKEGLLCAWKLSTSIGSLCIHKCKAKRLILTLM